ncbi:hypothetical protein SprV_0100242900 [Sparganum proliferum]
MQPRSSTGKGANNPTSYVRGRCRSNGGLTFVLLKCTPPAAADLSSFSTLIISDCTLDFQEYEIIIFLASFITIRNKRQFSITDYVAHFCMYAKLCNLFMFWRQSVTFACLYGILWILQSSFLFQPVYKGPESVFYFRPQTFDEVVRHGDPRVTWIIAFYTAWSPACNALAPIFSELSHNYALPFLKFGKVDVTRSPDLARACNVDNSTWSKQLPTIIMFRGDTAPSTGVQLLFLIEPCLKVAATRDWFDENDAAISNALAEKNRLHKAYFNPPTDDDNKAAFYHSRCLAQQRLREMQAAWTASKFEEIQGYVDRNERKNFIATIKAVYGAAAKGTAPLLTTDGSTTLTERTQILQRLVDHFRRVLNRPSTHSDSAIARPPQMETDTDLDLLPTLHETIRTVQQLSSVKVPESDAITPEIYKHGGTPIMDHLTALFQAMWRQGQVPQDFKDATIVHLYRRKRNRQICDNHRDIFLLNIVGKIFDRILLNSPNHHLEHGLLPESQCGFRRIVEPPTSSSPPVNGRTSAR